jgi:hypothetical protein
MEIPDMATSSSKVQQFILLCVAPIICSIAVGYLFDQGNVFNRHYGAFQFLWSAVVASMFYYLLVFLRMRDALLGLLLLFFLTFVTTQSTRAAFVLRDIFYFGGLGLSIVVYFKYFRLGSSDNYAYAPFMLAGIYAVAYIITSEIHMGILQAFVMETAPMGNMVSLASTSAFFGVLIGFAVGCGISLNERLWGKKKTIVRNSVA